MFILKLYSLEANKHCIVSHFFYIYIYLFSSIFITIILFIEFDFCSNQCTNRTRAFTITSTIIYTLLVYNIMSLFRFVYQRILVYTYLILYSPLTVIGYSTVEKRSTVEKQKQKIIIPGNFIFFLLMLPLQRVMTSSGTLYFLAC